MLILGINAYHAEASAALVQDGKLVAAAEEERFQRIKHVAGFPTEAVRFCLQAGRVDLKTVDAIAISRNPRAHFFSKAKRMLYRGVFSSAVQNRLHALQKIRNIKTTLAEQLGTPLGSLRAPVYFVEHHRAHLASSFYPSGWEEAVILSLDGFGDFLSGAWGVGKNLNLTIHGEVPFPHSLGILYTALTQFLGFQHWGDEYKVMGLAPYGNPQSYREAMESLVHETGGGYRMGLEFFRHQAEDVSMTWESGPPMVGTLFSKRMETLLGPPRNPEAPLDNRHADIAAALQERLERVVLQLMTYLGNRYALSNLCYAGGVALNCSLNGKIIRRTPFKQIFIQPAAHDAGTSLGAALYVHHHRLQYPRKFVMTHAAWGPEVQETVCRDSLEGAHLPLKKMEREELIRTAANALANGKILGWFQGRMEFGPRALGHRSLLADPRDPEMKAKINERIKRRESFRPFAPSILTERVPEYFPEGHPDRFMLFAYPIRKDLASKIPSVTHVDGTGRLQAVTQETDPLYWELIKAFGTQTGVPVLLNTSFNDQEPIVCRPEEAIACFQRNEIDCLALGPYWAEQKKQPL